MKPNAPFGVTLNLTHPGLLETEPNANQHTLRWAEVEVVLWWDGDGEDEFEVASRGGELGPLQDPTTATITAIIITNGDGIWRVRTFRENNIPRIKVNNWEELARELML
ncbi:hypothetical protein Tco_0651710 [Tanacetum coccineum]|uniref:Uncharacterized protein n=1 Tax=Tanacetum coccineum TaxID=301880 RepID=A0ABQ4WW70_9ASTR